jgi:hypothetical protein
MAHTEFKIKYHAPIQMRIVAVLMLAIFVVGLVVTYQYGINEGEQVKQAYLIKKIELNKRVAILTGVNQKLVESNAMFERSGKIDQQALQQTDIALRKMKEQFLDLKKEVTFYKGLVTPSDIQQGVQIKSFNIRSLTVPGTYLAKLVLIQSKNNRYVSGNISLTIDGLSSGEVKSIDLRTLINSEKKSLYFKFKYFKNLEIDLVLPEDFIPSSAIIEIFPEGSKIKPFKKFYNWAELNSSR